MAVYVDWLLTPEADRTPPTKKELAESLGVSTQTLRNYLDDPWLQRTLVQRGRTLNKVERAQDVLEALFQQASDPTHPRSVQAAKVWLEWVNQRHEENLSQDISDLSDEELLTLLTDMATEMAESNG
jgi:DNA-binding transcriptional MerR regulator